MVRFVEMCSTRFCRAKWWGYTWPPRSLAERIDSVALALLCTPFGPNSSTFQHFEQLREISAMATPAKMRLRSDKHLGNITKRGRVSQPAKVRSFVPLVCHSVRLSLVCSL